MSDREEAHRAAVRARLDALLDRLEHAHDLEFLELVLMLREPPFSEELALEACLGIAEWVAFAKMRCEQEVERMRRQQPSGKKPT